MRVTNNAFTNLAVSMIGFGVVIGVVFPLAVAAVGVSRSIALAPWFFGFTISAGIVVGGVNIILARLLVRPRLRLMASRMNDVEEGLRVATYTGDWTRCDPDECALPVDSDDEFGDAAASFNRLLQALADSHKVESRISDFTSAMSADLDVAAICEAAIDSFRRDLGAAGVAIIGDSGGSLRLLASHGLAKPEALIESDLVVKAVRSLATDSMHVPEHLVIDVAVATVRPHHVLVYPLVLESVAIGAVVLACASEPVAGARALGPLLVRTLAVALSNALSHEALQRLASHDALTGVLNRRAGLERLRAVFEDSLRAGQPMSVVMVDIDHFKQINDEHGHLTGDLALSAVAAAMSDAIRSDDFIVRYGGEEFVVGLPGAPGATVSSVAERIRAAAESVVLRSDAGVPVSVTVSAGWASSDGRRLRSELELVADADAALLRAKVQGRNRVVAA